MRAVSRKLRFAVPLVAAVLAGLAPCAARAAAPTLLVTFSTSGTISLTLADGTPVGTPNGAPTVIPAGYYTLQLDGPAACTYLPAFELHGPGVDFVSDMGGGTVLEESYATYLSPNSTYTWRSDGTNPPTVHTFVTSAAVLGSPTARSGTGGPTKGGTVANETPVGSDILRFRGRLTGTVDAAGRVAVSFKGRSVRTLEPGRYTLVVRDESTTQGFVLQRQKHKEITATGVRFVGERSRSVALAAGRWSVAAAPHGTRYPLLVRARTT
jgi:hypothetical protein